MAVTGIVLAAGAGSRLGTPKALVRTADGEPWVARASALLQLAGCERVVVVLGASAGDARALVPARAEIVLADDWAEGMSASLRAGLAAATGTAALITLVDLPELPLAVVRRVARGRPTTTDLRQATYGGRPGHPVLIGAAHWQAVAATVSGDRGARPYLVEFGVDEVECGDLWGGADVDRR
ncbi:nucleotidyltransferase family protein [soil metagenome]